MTLHLSARAGVGRLNEVANALAQAKGAGLAVTDLSTSNPTQFGLSDPSLLDVLAAHMGPAARYEPDAKGWLGARLALAARFGGTPNQYWLTASTSEAYYWLLTALCDVGDAVAVPQPGYPLVEPLARLAGVKVVDYGAFYVHPHGWELDLSSVAASLRPTDQAPVRGLVAINPNNPTGAYVCPDQGAALGQLAAKKQVALIADEVFFPFGLADGPHRPLADSAGPDTVVVTLGGLSKLLAAPQLKLGWLRVSGPTAATAGLAAALDVIADTYLSVNSPVAVALPALLELADSTVERIVARCRDNLAVLGGLPDGFRVRHTQGGWTALVDLPRVFDDDDMTHWLLDAGLAAHPGWFYDVADPDVIAVSLLPDPAVLTDAVRRLAPLSELAL